MLAGCGGAQTPADTADGTQATESAAASGASQPASEAESAALSPSVAGEEEGLQIPIEPKSGGALVGTATFQERADGVRVIVRVASAEPGFHGVHIHETGDCSARDASSAGGHYDPDGNPHGLPPLERHLGDLGNIGVMGPDGIGLLEIFVPEATLKPGAPNSLHDRAIVIHESLDRGVQPSGGAGARVGCGEIDVES